jgi:(4S)-4-hydroxy-5-phosphonooxypentane-2,3-dione isomerase
MQVLLVEFQVKAEHVAAFAQAIAANAKTSLDVEPGCLCFDVCRDPADAGVFLLYELYDDQAAIDVHLHSEHFLHFNTLTTPWVAHKSVRRLVLSR